MFAVEMLPGGHGDALVVEYGTRADPHQLLIDAGTFHSWEGVRTELLRRRKDRYEIFVITHVDEDHLGGSLSLLDDPNLKQRVDHVWFNGFIHCAKGGNVLGPVNGEQLTSRIVTGGLRWNEGFTPKESQHVGGPVVVPSAGNLPSIDLPGGARVVLLSPTGQKLKSMATKWKIDVENAGLVPGAGAFGHNKPPRPSDRAFDPLPDPLDDAAIASLAALNATDGSKANGASIAFILEFDRKRVLFGADAHASVLTKSLQRYAAEVDEERARLDLVKLAHHGSNANVSAAMLATIDCERYLISTNGDNFAHPDDEAIAKVIVSGTGHPTFYCNYKTARTEPWGERGPQVGATFVFPRPGKTALRVAV